jgi:hypothetical protein
LTQPMLRRDHRNIPIADTSTALSQIGPLPANGCSQNLVMIFPYKLPLALPDAAKNY